MYKICSKICFLKIQKTQFFMKYMQVFDSFLIKSIESLAECKLNPYSHHFHNAWWAVFIQRSLQSITRKGPAHNLLGVISSRKQREAAGHLQFCDMATSFTYSLLLASNFIKCFCIFNLNGT